MDESGSKYVTQNETNSIMCKLFFLIYSFVVVKQYSLSLNDEHLISRITCEQRKLSRFALISGEQVVLVQRFAIPQM